MNLIVQLRNFSQFSPSEKVVADYILKHLEEVIKMSARDLGRKTYTSASNVIRICQKLGVEGFVDFKMQIAKEIHIYQQKDIAIDTDFPIREADKVDDVALKITQLYINAIKETQLLLDTKTIERIINLIEFADIIDFYGMGASKNVANDAMLKFLRIGKPVSIFNDFDLQQVNAFVSNKKHLAFLISYTGKTEEILKIANILYHNNVPMISITSVSINPLVEFSTEHLYVSSREREAKMTAMVPRIAMLYLFDIIFSSYCARNYQQTVQMLSKTYIENKIDNFNIRKIKKQRIEIKRSLSKRYIHYIK